MTDDRRAAHDRATSARERIADAEVPGWAGGVMYALRWVTLLVEVQAMVLLGTLAGGIVLGVGPALRGGGAVVARMTDEPRPWRLFWRTWRTGFGRTNALFAPVWGIALLLWFDGVALRLIEGPVRAGLLGGLVVIGLWTAVMLTYWPVVVDRQDRGFGATWRLLLLSPLLGPATALAVLVVWLVVWVAWTFLPLAAVLAGASFWLWATGRLARERLDRLDAVTTR